MMRSGRVAAGVGCATAALLLGACSLDSSSLTTGTLLGGTAKPKVQSPVEVTTSRALHVAAISAKASRCGYVFDPFAVRASYLAFEAGQSTPELAARAEKSYDFTHASISKAIAGQADYCSDDQTATIKRDLNNVLAGNFSPPVKQEVDVGLSPSTVEPIDREKLFRGPER
jgi:hypothetical protein